MKTSLLNAASFSLALLAYNVTFAAEKKVTVAADGSGDFKTIQEAVTAAPAKSAERTVIQIKPGKYEEQVIVPKDKTKITFQGESAETTVLSWSKNVNDPAAPGVHKFNPGIHVQGADFQATNMTFANTAGDRGQALAAIVDGDRAVFTKCRLLGWQDTLMVNNGRQYFKDCYIEGRVDFIYGSGTAIFDHCEIHSKNGGYVTAANTPQEKPFGFVFLNCKLTGDDKPWVDPSATNPPKVQKLPNTLLGRPWRPYASVTYINCEMGDHIKPEGWSNWGKVENESTARYAEYGNTGPGATPDKRVPWSKKLSKDEADKITVESVLGGSDNWKPE